MVISISCNNNHQFSDSLRAGVRESIEVRVWAWVGENGSG